MNKVIYIHKKATDNEVFYVGMGESERPYHTRGRSKMWNRIVDKHGYNVEVIMTGLNKQQASMLEIDLISLHGRRDEGTGTLANHTDGGECNDNSGNKKVVNTNSGEVYDTIHAASKALGVDRKILGNQLNGKAVIKYPVKFLDSSINLLLKSSRPFKRTLDLKTNKTYSSMSECARDTGISRDAIRDDIRRPNKKRQVRFKNI